MNDLAQRLDAAVTKVRSLADKEFTPRVGVVLGSGLGAFADTLRQAVKLPYADVGFPTSSIAGHAGNLCLGFVGDRNVPVACLQGRVHGYEGHPADRVVFAVRTLARWGCTSFVLTNAAGGVNANFNPGDLMVVSDHINLMGWNPLTGPNDNTLGTRFVDLTAVYDPELRAMAHAAGKQMGVALRDGVYCGLSGPTYETPAEIRMIRALGGDAVGMSTVPEAIALRHLGVRCVAVSCITNKGAGMSQTPLDHREVQEVANRTRTTFVELLGRLVGGL